MSSALLPISWWQWAFWFKGGKTKAVNHIETECPFDFEGSSFCHVSVMDIDGWHNHASNRCMAEIQHEAEIDWKEAAFQITYIGSLHRWVGSHKDKVGPESKSEPKAKPGAQWNTPLWSLVRMRFWSGDRVKSKTEVQIENCPMRSGGRNEKADSYQAKRISRNIWELRIAT